MPRGRPPKPDGRGDHAYVLGIRLTAAERRAWEIASGHMSMSDFVRSAVNRYITLGGPKAAARALIGE